MNEKKKELLSLIKRLELPVLPGEGEKMIENLTDDEVNSLVFVYRAFWRHQQALDETLRQQEPQAYQQLEEDHQRRLVEIEEGYARGSEMIQEKADQKADEFDRKDFQEVKKEVAQIEAVKNKTLKAREDFLRKLNSFT